MWGLKESLRNLEIFNRQYYDIILSYEKLITLGTMNAGDVFLVLREGVSRGGIASYLVLHGETIGWIDVIGKDRLDFTRVK
jgi:hypothetical protein